MAEDQDGTIGIKKNLEKAMNRSMRRKSIGGTISTKKVMFDSTIIN